MVDDKKDFSILELREKVKGRKGEEANSFDFSAANHSYPPRKDNSGYSWTAVSNEDEKDEKKSSLPLQPKPDDDGDPKPAGAIYVRPSDLDKKFFHIPDALKNNEGLEFSGKSLIGGVYAKADLQGANFSAANLTQVDFSGANLKGADLSGSDMTDANFSGADLTGAILSGANLLRTNFTGAKLNKVILTEANLEDAILLDIEIDDLAIEELQALIEYMAVYYPDKLNLRRINLTLLDLSKLDLRNINLRGVDFTGCSMKGVKIWELDISECIISPEQIAEALGRVPSAQELARLLAPKVKKKKKEGLDMSDLFFDNGKEFGVWDVTKDKGLDIGKLVESGMKLFRKSAPRPPVKDEEILAHIKEEKLRNNDEKSHNEQLKERINQRKQEERQKLAAMQDEFKNEVSKDNEKEAPSGENKRSIDPAVREMAVIRDRSRD